VLEAWEMLGTLGIGEMLGRWWLPGKWEALERGEAARLGA
jgi:hypothetical protein